MSNFLQWSLFNERVDLDECLSDLLMVEHSGIEPLTSSLPAKRSPS